MPNGQSLKGIFNISRTGKVSMLDGILRGSSRAKTGDLLIGCKHLLAFIFPLTTFSFLLTGVFVDGQPHSIVADLAWTIPFWLVLYIDWKNPTEKVSGGNCSQQFYDGILYALVALQIANVVGMLAYVNLLRWNSQNEIIVSLASLVALRFLVGTSSGTSGIVVAHELIHRPARRWQILGRLLLCSVCYEHFTITHKRGHHLTIGMPHDIATAKLGESFKDYWRRIRGGYLRYAWQSEQDRLAMLPNRATTILHNEVLRGLLAEASVLVLVVYVFGWLAALLFLYQALAAVRILEAVNYFQHWGLENGQFGNTLGWVSRSWMSRYALIGLSHHIGHHLDENKRFYEIPFSSQGPVLPYGYFVMNLWVKLNNASYQKMAAIELDRFRATQSQPFRAETIKNL